MLAAAISGVVGVELPLEEAKKQEQEDLQHLDYIFELQSDEDYAVDEAQWLGAIREFLKKKRPSNTTKNAVNGGRRNRTRRLQKM